MPPRVVDATWPPVNWPRDTSYVLVITRVDRNTVIHLSANITSDASLSNVQNEFLKRVAAIQPPLPKSIVVRPRPLGQQDFMAQTLVGLGTSLVLSIMLVFLLMAVVGLWSALRRLRSEPVGLLIAGSLRSARPLAAPIGLPPRSASCRSARRRMARPAG